MTTAVSSTLSHPEKFPIVGIGCSAGGLEAVEKFLTHVAENSGMGFVIVQHLDPNRDSHLPQLLSRMTSMTVVQINDAMKLEPDTVYVIPPNKDLSISHGVLRLADHVGSRYDHLPIDFFLRTLAEDQLDNAIAVILSGMGSDGVLGLRAIKENNGLVLAQEPASAKADNMPKSAIMTGFVDIVSIPEEMPSRIAAYTQYVPHIKPPKVEPEAKGGLHQIITLLLERTGNDFSLYKTSTLYRRIERRIALHQLSKISHYVRYLRENPQELDLLFRELLIGVTNFFRDPIAWEQLGYKAIPNLLKTYPEGRKLRAWVPACSSGEEAYTLAIAFREALIREAPAGIFTLQIFATDLDPDAINKARHGFYHRNIAADMAPELLARYFVEDKENNGYRISKEIREMVIFSPQNVISDPPFTKLDIISCRNLLIYFGQSLQKKLLPLFHYALNPNGVMMLGSAETIGNFNHLFAPIDPKARIFQRLNQSLLLSNMDFPAKPYIDSGAIMSNVRPEDQENIGALTDRFIQQNYAPAAVLVNADGDILYISGRTGRYLEPAAGKVNINLHVMARDGLREALVGVIKKALQQQPEPIHLNGLSIMTEGGACIVNLSIQGLDKPEALRGRVLVVFSEVGKKSRKKGTSASNGELAVELQQAREALQRMHEDMQTSMEELVSSNEELQSTNEELQSTNEELTTSKEELQSLNEELHTVNAELQSKVDELTDLTWVKNDMMNLLNSIEITTVFLDNHLKLRRFTPRATGLFKLIPEDVGRPLTDIATNLEYPELNADMQGVLENLMFVEKQVKTHNGSWFRVRIMPYRTLENVIDGVVMTFIDVTEVRRLEDELKDRKG